MLQVSERTVREHYKAGLLPGQDCRRPGTTRCQLRFSDSDLHQWRINLDRWQKTNDKPLRRRRAARVKAWDRYR